MPAGALAEDLERIANAAVAHADGGTTLTGVLPTEPRPGLRVYLCAFEAGERRMWLALDDDGRPISDRRDVRDAVSIAALCEVAEEAAFPGDLDELRAQLVALRVTEQPEGIEEAEAATLALQHAVGTPPQLATPDRLDGIGEAAMRLERALDPTAPSPFAAAMRSASDVADALWRDVEASYTGGLEGIE